jgi:hypothetical protein
MSLTPVRQVRNNDKSLMDLQSNATASIAQLQGQALAEVKFFTVQVSTIATGPQDSPGNPSGDIVVAHNFGRKAKGLLLSGIPYTQNGPAANWASLGIAATVWFSPTNNAQPNVFAIIRTNVTSPAQPAPSLFIDILVF